MDFFTDASLNSKKSVAGIGCICIDDKKGETSEYSAFYQIDNIHLAELYALLFAVQKARLLGVKSARVISDSAGALNILHKYVCVSGGGGVKNLLKKKQFLRTLEASPLQKIALDKMVDIFKTSSIFFNFKHVNGHQKSASVGSDAYWNKRADRASKKGRAFGEVLEATGNVRPIEAMLEDTSKNEIEEDWRSRIHVSNVQVKTKDKTIPKKVSRHKKSNADTYNVRIMLNLRIKIH